ncbi:hypothetical protein JOC77_000818 [Peribacillus deserti]|uniref:Uncharacterized protein n=1 Tax=Peribacillus deserti TaxID=673318 RepID=A0ABS2QE22_9BACI|nr:hypothetical protein [Peribacillus deserti]
MLHHVENNVSDLPSAADFWGWILPQLLCNLSKMGLGIIWKHKDTYLVFVQSEERHLDPPFHRAKTV